MKYINTATGKDYQLFLLLKNIAVISKNRVVDIYYSYTYSKTRGGETVKKIVHTLLDYSHPVKKTTKTRRFTATLSPTSPHNRFLSQPTTDGSFIFSSQTISQVIWCKKLSFGAIKVDFYHQPSCVFPHISSTLFFIAEMKSNCIKGWHNV